MIDSDSISQGQERKNKAYLVTACFISAALRADVRRGN
jgi:hypothetical protein